MENEAEMDWLKDEIIKCCDCESNFVLSSGEKQFYLTHKPKLNLPKRCPACRQRRKETATKTGGGNNG